MFPRKLFGEAVILTKLQSSFSGSGRQHNHRDQRQHLVSISTNVNTQLNERSLEKYRKIKNVFAEGLGFKHMRKWDEPFIDKSHRGGELSFYSIH